MKQLINNNLLRRIHSFALIGNKRNNYNLSLGVVQVPPRVLYFDKAHPLPNRKSKDGNLSSQASKWES